MNFIRFSSLALGISLLSGGAAIAAGYKVVAGCTTPPAVSSGHSFYIDPVNGSATGDGSLAHPWNSLQAVTTTSGTYASDALKLPGCQGNSGSTCIHGPLLSSVAYWHSDPVSGVWGTTANPNAPIKPGDTVYLMSGNYGDYSMSGITNSAFVTLAAAPGQTPIFSSLSITGGAKWIIEGLTFRALASGYSAFVNVNGTSSAGTATDIILDGNNLASQDDTSSWQPSDWLSSARYRAINVDGGDQYSTYAKCVAITNNALKNIRFGMSAFADYMMVDSNTIDYFGDDGIDYAGNNQVLSNNTITNNLNLGDSNHNDAMQGQVGRGVGGTTVYNNIKINGNTIIAQYRSTLTFPGDLQGIDAFDMDWSNLKVFNNTVIINTYHGISFYSLHGGLIANNTVRASGPDTTWIAFGDTSHQGTPSNNIIVRNNITSNLYNLSSDPTITVDHNLVGDQITWMVNGHMQYLSAPGLYANNNAIDPNRLSYVFKNFNTSKAKYDMHLMSGTPAVGTGTPTSAPATISGIPRLLPVDLGALVYVPGA